VNLPAAIATVAAGRDILFNDERQAQSPTDLTIEGLIPGGATDTTLSRSLGFILVVHGVSAGPAEIPLDDQHGAGPGQGCRDPVAPAPAGAARTPELHDGTVSAQGSDMANRASIVAVVMLLGCGGTSAIHPDATGTGGAAGAPSDGQAGEVPVGNPGAACQRESDCGSPNLVCGYKIADGCSATGVCIQRYPLPGQPACAALIDICGCDGTTVTVGCGYASGYAPAPIASSLSCPNDGATPTCGGKGAFCGDGPCCPGLGCSPSGAPTVIPGNCVPL
jgi:hypothetical protein